MGERAYSYVKRKQPPPASGYTNFYVTVCGNTGLKIGSVDYCLMAITTETIKFRDDARAKQRLPKADY